MSRRVVAAVFLLLSLGTLASTQVPAGGEFRVNTYTTNRQYWPSVASDAAGSFVVVWHSFSQSGDVSVFGQRYDASGAHRGAEFRVNASTTDTRWLPRVASDAAGNFVVAWRSMNQDGSSWGVFARRFDASGVPRGLEFQVNSYTTSYQVGPSVASDAAGNFVVVWSGYFQDGSGAGVFGQRYEASGTPRGTEFQVSAYTTDAQAGAEVASDAAGNFVVVWSSWGRDGSSAGVFAQRYDAAGARRGAEFQVNSYTTGSQWLPFVASDGAGSFVVVWTSSQAGDGSGYGVFGQRYDASGARRGQEFQVNSYTTGDQIGRSVACDSADDFVVAWTSDGQDGSMKGIFAQRYDAAGARRGQEFWINTYTTGAQDSPSVASDAAGNFVVTWHSWEQDGDSYAVVARRYGGLLPAALAVDSSVSTGSDGNHVLEPGETAVGVAPSWHNANGTAQTLDGVGMGFGGPPASGVAYELADAAAAYGMVANGSTAPCSDCYRVGVGFGGTRPSLHWDATFTERLIPDALGQTKPWSLHVGDSFTDVPRTSGYYRFVETLLHKKLTGGCSASQFCPADPVTREQMSVFVLAGKEGSSYLPTACGTPVFADVPAGSPFCRFVEELARRGVVSGCGGGNYCPTNPVTREQMSVFLLHVLDPGLSPPACATPVFPDVPAASPFCRWIEELARRGITAGCGGGYYCPADPVTREQMAVFLTATFALGLYGP